MVTVPTEFKKTFCNNLSGAPPYHACHRKCAKMDHEGPSMSVIIYNDHQHQGGVGEEVGWGRRRGGGGGGVAI